MVSWSYKGKFRRARKVQGSITQFSIETTVVVVLEPEVSFQKDQYMSCLPSVMPKFQSGHSIQKKSFAGNSCLKICDYRNRYFASPVTGPLRIPVSNIRI